MKKIYFTSGTIFIKTKHDGPYKYFYGDSGLKYNEFFGDNIKKLFKADECKYLYWDGGNEKKNRADAIDKFVDIILNESNVDDEIILIGHSHGGNIMIEVANRLWYFGKLRVISLNAPVRKDYKPSKPIINNAIQLYSIWDWVQVWGSKDSKRSLLLFLFLGIFTLPIGRHKFKGANNIDITKYVKKYSRKIDGICKYHQSTRYYNFLKEILIDEGLV
jgi:hypothetical protein